MKTEGPSLLATAPSLPELHDLVAKFYGTTTDRYHFAFDGTVIRGDRPLPHVRWRLIGKRYRFEWAK